MHFFTQCFYRGWETAVVLELVLTFWCGEEKVLLVQDQKMRIMYSFFVVKSFSDSYFNIEDILNMYLSAQICFVLSLNVKLKCTPTQFTYRWFAYYLCSNQVLWGSSER